jgi:hypothetical protein
MPSRCQEVDPHAERRVATTTSRSPNRKRSSARRSAWSASVPLSALRQLPGIPRGLRLFAGTTHGPTSHTPTSPKPLRSEPLGYGNGCPQVGALGLWLQIA